MIKNYIALDKPLILNGQTSNKAFKSILKTSIESQDLTKRFIYIGFKQWTYGLEVQTGNTGFAPFFIQRLDDQSNVGQAVYPRVLNFLGNTKLAFVGKEVKRDTLNTINVSVASNGNSSVCKVITDFFIAFSNENSISFSDVDFSEYGYKTLKITPVYSGFSVSDSISEFVHYQLKGGFGKIRKDILKSSKTINVRWEVGLEGYKYLSAFYEYFKQTLKPFFAELYIKGLFAGELEPCMCKFLPNTFKLDSVKGHTFSISATLEIEELVKIPEIENEDLVDKFKGC